VANEPATSAKVIGCCGTASSAANLIDSRRSHPAGNASWDELRSPHLAWTRYRQRKVPRRSRSRIAGSRIGQRHDQEGLRTHRQVGEPTTGYPRAEVSQRFAELPIDHARSPRSSAMASFPLDQRPDLSERKFLVQHQPPIGEAAAEDRFRVAEYLKECRIQALCACTRCWS
jgi:hypothetical protein